MNSPHLERRHTWRLVVSLFISGLLLATLAHANPGSNVLLVNSYHHGFKWTDDIVAGVKSVLAGNVDLRIEYLDNRRVSSKPYLENIYESFRIKFKGIRYDVIIVSDDPALDLLLDLRDELFPGTPVVFCGINDFNEARLRGQPLYTGVVEDVDLKSTLEMVHKLHPRARTIVSPINSNATGRANLKLLEQVIPFFQDTFSFEIQRDPKLTTFLERLATAPKDDVAALLIGRFSNDQGGEIPITESTPMIAEAGTPAYSLWEYYLGYGIVGGRLTNGFYQGKTAGEIASRLLHGETNIPVDRNSPNPFMFDYNELLRFGLEAASLPKGSVVINKPQGFYARYGTAIHVAILVFLAMSVVIAYMSRLIIHKNRAQKELKHHKEGLEAMVAERTAKVNAVNTTLTAEIAVRQRAEEALAQSERKYRQIFDGMSDGLALHEMIYDQENEPADYKFLEVNPAFERLTGFSSEHVVGKTVRELLPNIELLWLKRYHDVLSDGEPVHFEEYASDLGKQFEVVAFRVGRRRFASLFRDITERNHLREMMVQSEKMISLGTLAAGMAHEVNNPLAAIAQSVQVALNRLSPDVAANIKAAQECGCEIEPLGCYLEKRQVISFLKNIREAGSRAAHIVANLLEFSRKSESHRSLANINSILDKSVELARMDFDLKKKYDFNQIHIVRDYAPDLPDILCARIEIEQVILNLLKNAVQAIAQLPEPFANPVIHLRTTKEGDTVRIEVEDNGPGIAEPLRKRIFDPFFTTKPVGEGTGLGLSVSYFIVVTKHNGSFEVHSKPGQGTCFVIHLPVRQDGHA